MDLTEGSETSPKLNLTPGKYPKKKIKDSEHGENLKSRIGASCPEHGSTAGFRIAVLVFKYLLKYGQSAKKQKFYPCVIHHRQNLIVLSGWCVAVCQCALFVSLAVMCTNSSFAIQADRDRGKATSRMLQQ
jgi:hypothetical protein